MDMGHGRLLGRDAARTHAGTQARTRTRGRVIAGLVALAAVAATAVGTIAPAAGDGSGARLRDGFDRADAASLGTADSGQVWSDLAGGWAVAGGVAAPEPGYSLSVVDSGGPDGVVSTTLVQPAPEFWLVLRASDGASYWRFGRWQSGAYQLQQVAGNALGSPVLSTPVSVMPAAGDRLSCRLTPTRLGCSVNGTEVVSTTDRFNGSAGSVGFAAWDGSGASPVRFDDLQVEDLATGPDLAVSISDDDPVEHGGQLRWTVTVTNVGPGPASAASLTAPVPAGVTGLAAQTTAGSCTAGVASLICALGPLAPGASASVVVTGTAPPAGSSVTFTASATAAGDVDPTNDSATATTTVQAPLPAGTRVADRFDRADAAALGTATTGQAWSSFHGSFRVLGGNAVPAPSGYDMAVLDGAGPSGDVSVRLVQPSPEFWLVLRAEDGASYWRFGRWQSGSYQLQQIAGNGLATPPLTVHATVSAAAGDVLACRYNGSAIECGVNGVPVVSATGASTSAALVGLAHWSGGGAPLAAFDDFVVSDLPLAPDLAVTITDVDPVLVSGSLRWTIQVANVGTSAALGSKLSITRPSSAWSWRVSPSQGSCSLSANPACSLGTIQPGATATVVLTARAPSTQQVLLLSASATTVGDPRSANDADSEYTSVRKPPTPGAKIVDDFNRTLDGLGVADSGDPWTVHTGAFAVAGGVAGATTPQLSVASVDGGFAFGSYDLTVTETGAGGFWALFRVVDAQNFYRVGPDASGVYRIERVVDGVPHGLQFLTQRAEIAAADGDVIRIVNRPDDGVFVTVNGRHLLDAGDVRAMDAPGFGFATASTSVRIGRVVVSQVMAAPTVVTDSFTRPNSTSLGTPSTGVAYQWIGNLGVTSNMAYYPGSYYGLGVLDTSSEAADVRARVVQLGDEAALVFRYSEDGSYYRFGRLRPGGKYEFDLVSGNSSSPPPVPVQVVSTRTPANGDTLMVRQYLDGRVEGLVNGTVVLRFTDTVTNRRATYYGLSFGGAGTARFDDFRVQPE